MQIRILVYVLIILAKINYLKAYQGPYTLLTDYLLSSHDRNTPPEDKINVDYDIELVKILEVEELKQRISVFVYIVEQWTDLTLSWDSNNFSQIDRTWLPIDSIWIPDILVYNMLDHVNVLKDIRNPVEIYADGRVVHSYPAVYEVTCEIIIS
uniref:Neurotransmitter-gated ion-channel ligand-binding domain-containing protein n=1 Tax=Acrobeloides nanus TaxID=290746 RepID=A0A914CT62_9BILA